MVPSNATIDTAVSLLIALVALVYRAGRAVGRIETRLHELATNHIAHLQSEIHELRKDIRAVVTANLKERTDDL